MKTSLRLAVGLAAFLLAAPALAADLPVKTPAAVIPSSVCTLTSCSGWYVGMGLSGNGSNADIIGNGINGSVFAAGGTIDVHGGYQLWNGSYFAAAEIGIGNEFLPSQPISTLGGQSLVGYEKVKLGMGLQGLFNPNTAPAVAGQAPTGINIPASIANVLMSPYVQFGAQQRKGVSQWISGAGAEFLIASHWNLDLGYTYATPVNALPSENKVTIGLNYHF